jgi:hypothetical protein
MVRIKYFQFVFYFLCQTCICQINEDIEKNRGYSKKIRFGFNLDWHLGYSYAKSGAPLEFLGRQPNPDVFGGSFDFLYKDDWLLNLSWKVRQNYYRTVHRFTPPKNNNHFNRGIFGYSSNTNLIALYPNFQSFGLTVSRHVFKKSRLNHYIDFGIVLNLIALSKPSAFSNNGFGAYEYISNSGGVINTSKVYEVQINTIPSSGILENKFLPKIYNDNGLLPLWGLLSKNALNHPKYSLISYKFGYTGYYSILKGKMQLIFGCGIEYCPTPLFIGNYTLFSKYDNVNTSGSFKRYLSNAYINLGVRFGKMGKEYFRN